MKLDTKAFTLAIAAVTAVGYLICTALIALSPQATKVLLSTATHLDLRPAHWSLSWGGAAAGLILTVAFAALAAWLVATVYNALTETTEPQTERIKALGPAREKPAG